MHDSRRPLTPPPTPAAQRYASPRALLNEIYRRLEVDEHRRRRIAALERERDLLVRRLRASWSKVERALLQYSIDNVDDELAFLEGAS